MSHPTCRHDRATLENRNFRLGGPRRRHCQFSGCFFVSFRGALDNFRLLGATKLKVFTYWSHDDCKYWTAVSLACALLVHQ